MNFVISQKTKLIVLYIYFLTTRTISHLLSHSTTTISLGKCITEGNFLIVADAEFMDGKNKQNSSWRNLTSQLGLH